MALGRRLVTLVALASLAATVYGGIVLAFSVPIPADEIAANAFPAHVGRAVVVPMTSPELVPTVLSDEPGHDGRAGAILAVGAPSGHVPARAANVSFGRALAHVAPDANGTYPAAAAAFLAPPQGNATDPGRENATAANGTHPEDAAAPAADPVAALAQGRSGFLVRADNATAVRFVAEDEVVGQVARLDPPGRAGVLVLSGGVSFAFLALTLALTHRGSGMAAVRACGECGGALHPDLAFCARCGAWLPQKAQGPEARSSPP